MLEARDMPDHLRDLVEALAQLSPHERYVVVKEAEAAAFPPSQREVLYADEAAAMLGLDRLRRPEAALQKLLNRGDLPRRKINGRLIFHRHDLQRLIEHGSRRKRRGRPPGSKNRRQPA